MMRNAENRTYTQGSVVLPYTLVGEKRKHSQSARVPVLTPFSEASREKRVQHGEAGIDPKDAATDGGGLCRIWLRAQFCRCPGQTGYRLPEGCFSGRPLMVRYSLTMGVAP